MRVTMAVLAERIDALQAAEEAHDAAFEAQLDQVERTLARLLGIELPVESTDEPKIEQAEPDDEPDDDERRKRANLALSDWMTGQGLVPAGRALEAARNGNRGPKTLKKLNDADGLTPPKAEPPIVKDTVAPEPEIDVSFTERHLALIDAFADYDMTEHQIAEALKHPLVKEMTGQDAKVIAEAVVDAITA